MGPIKLIIFVSLYWLTLPIIGHGLLQMASRRRLSARARNAMDFIESQPFLARFSIATACTVFVSAVFALPCYLLHVPASVFTVFYLVLLAVGGGYVAWSVLRNLFTTAPQDVFGLKDQTLLVKLLFVVLGLAILGDFAFAEYVKSYVLVSADSYVHLSRIVTILHDGFTIQSGFFGGPAETGYHYNVIYALYVPLAQLSHKPPFELWEYSFGFFRVLAWASIFALAWHVMVRWLKDKMHALLGATVTTIFAISYASAAFYTALYPNQIVISWLILFIIFVSYYLSQKRTSTVPPVALAFLITMTHPTYAFMSALFLGIVLVIRVLQMWRAGTPGQARPEIIFYAALMALLMLGPVRTLFFPNHITTVAELVGAFPLGHLGPFTFKKPDAIQWQSLSHVVPLLLGTLGLGYILVKLWPERRQWALICALIIFFPIIAYNPIIFTVLHTTLPLWVLGRFTTMNVLVLLSVPLGVYALCHGAYSATVWQRVPRWLKKGQLVAVLGAAIVLGIAAYFVSPLHGTVAATQVENDHYYMFMRRSYDSLQPLFNNKQVVVANKGDSYLLSAVLPVQVIAIEDGHMTPAADAADRLKCQQRLLQNLDYADLVAARANYVVVPKYDKTAYLQARSIADNRPYLHVVADGPDFYVYGFDKSKPGNFGGRTPYEPCARYHLIEASS